MRRAVSEVAWYRYRRTFRRRFGGYLTIVLLVGLVGGLGMGAIVGARRTASAFPNYLAASRASDLQVTIYPTGPTLGLYNPAITRQLARLPHVRRVAAIVYLIALPLSRSGHPELSLPIAENEVNTVGPVNGMFVSQDRLIADQGRLPEPGHPDEMVASASAARLLGWHVGQVIPIGGYTFAAAFSSTGPPTVPPVARIDARLVGIVAFPQVIRDAVDSYPTFVVFSPAFTDRLLREGAAGYAEYELRLDGGAADVAAVEREVIRVVPPDSTYNFHVTSVVEGQVQRAIRPETIALGAFGVIAALAAFFIAVQAISRAVRAGGRELEVLRALGAPQKMILVDCLVGPLVATVVGAMLAVLTCVALSPVSPIGAVRQVDSSPGFDFDWTVLLAGAGVIVIGLGAVATALAYAVVPPRGTTRQTERAESASRVANGAVRLGLPAPAVAGIRFAVERGRGRDAVPVGSAMLGAALAVAVVVTTLTFGSGLHTLVSQPQLYGWNWNYAIEQVGGGNVPPATLRLLAHDHDVAAWTGFNFANAQIDGQTVPILLTNAGSALGPPILSGHTVEGNRQIVLGGATLAQLHQKIGGTVVVSYGNPRNGPVFVPPTRMQIVGTATLPAIGNNGEENTSMGTGALIPTGIEPPAMARALRSSDPNLNGPPLVAVALRPGVTPAAGLASLQRIARESDRVVEADPNAGGKFTVVGVEQPAEIVNYRAMGNTPTVLAVGLAAGAVVALGLTLLASVRRRRRELALLKTLGFARRQLASVVLWQASVAAVVGLVVGLPLGIALGRSLWSLFARQIDAVPKPTVPVPEVVLVAVGALVLANLVALVPGRRAARVPTASLLRVE